jgi:riboflavin kinase/FMN adenylyltransferase
MKIKGIVVSGKQLGRTIGFPTANIAARFWEGDEPAGVYAAWFRVENKTYPCMLNIGKHPTVPEGAPTIEAHIFNYDQDIYGLDISIETVQFLRGEQRFPSVEALREQLEQDKLRALEILNHTAKPGIE